MDTTLIAVRHIPIRYKEKTLPNEGGQALEVAKRGCGISPQGLYKPGWAGSQATCPNLEVSLALNGAWTR